MSDLSEWRPFAPGSVRRAACVTCGMLSPWQPKNWHFKYEGLRGGPRKGAAKVKTIRICPDCLGKE